MSGAAGAVARSLRRVLAIARKELRQLARDRLTLAMIAGIPTLQLVLFGYAINLDMRGIPTAVLDRSRSALSRQLLGELEATQTFRIRTEVGSEANAVRLLERSEVGAVVVIPPDLDRRVERGRGAEISLLVDATNPTTAAAALLGGEGLGHSLAGRYRPFAAGAGPPALRPLPEGRTQLAAAADLARPEPVRIVVLPFYSPERRTPVFIVPGLVGVILTMTMMLMTALAIVRERERGTLEFLIATPVRRGELMVGKIVPYILVGHVQVALILGLGALLFDVPLHGSMLHLGVGAAVFIAGMLAMGLVISAAARTQF